MSSQMNIQISILVMLKHNFFRNIFHNCCVEKLLFHKSNTYTTTVVLGEQELLCQSTYLQANGSQFGHVTLLFIVNNL